MSFVAHLLRAATSASLAAPTVQPSHANSTLESSEICARIDIKCTIVEPFQPSSAQMESISIVHSRPNRTERTIAIDGIPFSKYWLLGYGNAYVFHPSKFGEYVLSHVENESFRQSLPALTKRVAIRLPNGSLAFYYPNQYPLNRMRGPDLMYSAYGQASVLHGYLRFHLLQDTPQSRQLLNRTLNAHFFPHKQGGINLGVAQLELPLFRSNPEIILNGWLHALLVLANYAYVMEDNKVGEYVRRNLKFFVKYHNVWYDDSRNILRYSDTSPHRVVINESAADQSFWIIYRSKAPEIPNYIFSPVLDFKNEYSAFDVRINNYNSRSHLTTLTLTCSGLYDTLVVSTDSFGSLRIRGGGYDPLRATPSGAGEWHKSKPQKTNGVYVVSVELTNDELICGYPTNFAKKDGHNLYHSYHLVALMLLASHPPYTDKLLSEALSEIALDWHDRTSLFPHSGYKFTNPNSILNFRFIRDLELFRSVTNFDELVETTEYHNIVAALVYGRTVQFSWEEHQRRLQAVA